MAKIASSGKVGQLSYCIFPENGEFKAIINSPFGTREKLVSKPNSAKQWIDNIITEYARKKE